MEQVQNNPSCVRVKKRLGAGSYLLIMSTGIIAWSLLALLACRQFALPQRISMGELNLLLSSAGAVLGWVFYAVSERRLRDLNFASWTVKVLAFPFFGVIVLPVLCFLSGPRWTHAYGDAPRPSGMLKRLAACVLFVVAVAVSREALLSYFATRHALAALG